MKAKGRENRCRNVPSIKLIEDDQSSWPMLTKAWLYIKSARTCRSDKPHAMWGEPNLESANLAKRRVRGSSLHSQNRLPDWSSSSPRSRSCSTFLSRSCLTWEPYLIHTSSGYSINSKAVTPSSYWSLISHNSQRSRHFFPRMRYRKLYTPHTV